jgi:hypothetical protein
MQRVVCWQQLIGRVRCVPEIHFSEYSHHRAVGPQRAGRVGRRLCHCQQRRSTANADGYHYTSSMEPASAQQYLAYGLMCIACAAVWLQVKLDDGTPPLIMKMRFTDTIGTHQLLVWWSVLRTHFCVLYAFLHTKVWFGSSSIASANPDRTKSTSRCIRFSFVLYSITHPFGVIAGVRTNCAPLSRSKCTPKPTKPCKQPVTFAVLARVQRRLLACSNLLCVVANRFGPER